MKKRLGVLLAVLAVGVTMGCGTGEETDAQTPAHPEAGQQTSQRPDSEASSPTPEKSHSSEQPTTTGKDAPGSVRTTPTAAPKYVPATDEKPAQSVPVPKISDETRKNTRQGRTATVEYYFKALHYLYETGGASPMKFIVHPACTECFEDFADVTEHYEKGGWIIPGSFEVLPQQSKEKRADEGYYEVRVTVREYYGRLGGVQTGKDGKTRAPGTLKGERLTGSGAVKDWLFYVHYDDTDRQNYLIGWGVEDSRTFTDPEQRQDSEHAVA